MNTNTLGYHLYNEMMIKIDLVLLNVYLAAHLAKVTPLKGILPVMKAGQFLM